MKSTLLSAILLGAIATLACSSVEPSAGLPNAPSPSPIPSPSDPAPPVSPSVPTAESFPPPTADLRVLANGEPADFNAFIHVDTLVFDASRSTGEGLTYHVDYSDGTWSQSVRAERLATTPYGNWARLTVTDRFGRQASDRDDYFLYQLDDRGQFEAYWGCQAVGVNPGVPAGFIFGFFSEAPSMSGFLNYLPLKVFAPLTGSIGTDRRVRLQAEIPAGSISLVLEGTIGVQKPPSSRRPIMNLIARGGAYDGRAVTCYQNRG